MRLHPRIILLISIIITGALAYLLGFSQVFVVKEIKIDIKDKKIAREVEAKLAQAPSVVKQIGRAHV